MLAARRQPSGSLAVVEGAVEGHGTPVAHVGPVVRQNEFPVSKMYSGVLGMK